MITSRTMHGDEPRENPEQTPKALGTNSLPVDVWTIPHLALGYLAAQAGAPLGAAMWGALAVEAVEVALSDTYPGLARESRANQLGDLAAFLGGFRLGSR